MGKFNSNCVTLLSISFFFFASILPTTSDPPLDICDNKNCGQGKCKAAGTSLVGFECDCNPGWTKIEIGTINFNCGFPTPTPPGFALPPPQINFSNPCAIVWCGEGNCVANGALYSCQCNKEASNLMNAPGLPCFKECFLGADCNNLGLGSLANPALQPPPPPSSVGAASGSSGASNWMSNIRTFIMVVSAKGLLTLFL